MSTDSFPADFPMRPFTDALFHCMAVLIPQMATADQEKIRAYLCKPKKHPISGLMTRMIAMSPMLAKEFENQPFEELRLTLGPLLFWGLTQPWANECDVSGCLQAWSERLTGKTHPTNLSMAILGLGVVSLVDMDSLRLDRAGKERLRGDIYRTTQALVPWDAPDSSELVLVPLAALAASCPKEKMGADSLSVHWGRSMRRAMSASSIFDQKQVVNAIFSEETLPASYSMAVIKAADPLVWLMPEFIPKINALLPKDDAARAKKMVWTRNSWNAPAGLLLIRPGNINRRLYKQYCPMLYLGLSLVVQKTEDWEDRAYVKAFVDSFTSRSGMESLPLPDHMVPEA